MGRSGHVVRIFDEEKVAINLGSQSGVEIGNRIFFYAPVVEIQDPESQEVLGSYRHLKATGKVNAVGDRFAIIGAFPRRERVAEPAPSLIWPLGRRSTVTKSVPGDLPVNEEQAEPIPTGDTIQVGDVVEVEISEDEPQPGPEEGNGEPQATAGG